MSDYAMTVTVPDPPAEVEPRIRAALADEGFGVLSEIDVQAALKDKLGEDVGHYTILGACNPPLAHQAIMTDHDIGALLPCNVVVRANTGGGTDIVAADPVQMLNLADSDLGELATDAGQRIKRALDSLTD